MYWDAVRVERYANPRVADPLFTVTRLLYFTASKAGSDPAHFAGMPSPAGAVMVICAVLVFSAWPVLVGLLAGAACVLMVSFDASRGSQPSLIDGTVVQQAVRLCAEALR